MKKNTAMNTLAYLGFVVACLGLGTLLYAMGPAILKTFGLVWVLTGGMFLPGLVYCLLHKEQTAREAPRPTACEE